MNYTILSQQFNNFKKLINFYSESLTKVQLKMKACVHRLDKFARIKEKKREREGRGKEA